MSTPKSAFKKIAVMAARAGDSKKAEPVAVYDLAGKSTLADYAVLLGAESAPHLEAVEDEVSRQLKGEGVYCLHKDGARSKNWKVLDYGGVLVHIYDSKAAEFYAIDKVYNVYSPIEWEVKPEAPAPAPKAPEAKPAKKAPAKKAKKAASKKPAKKAPAKKTVKKAVKKAAVKKAPAKKAAVKKTAAKKTAVKKAPRKAMKKPVKKAVKKIVKKASKKK